MYAVIFRATIKKLDSEYSDSIVLLRKKAKEYGCIDFISCTEGNEEITISYWQSEDQIKNWKNDPDHIKAQEMGKTRWYASYSVDVVEVKRSYSK